MSSFDAYTNRMELGRGGMSTVYRATAPDGRTVALKVLAIHLAADRNALIRFQNELRLLEELDHPNIVHLLGADLRCNPPYLVMEYVDGMSLERWVTQKGELPPHELGPLLSDIGRALDYAHDEGIIHRDVKPSNILIRRSSGRALLTDFGVAKSADVTAFTATHARVGSVYYMSPEQIEGRLELTRASDVYSLGVTVYLALTGRHPFEGTNEIAIARRHLETEARHISELNPEVPRRVGDVVMRALEKQAYRRHETAGDFARRFRAAVAAEEQAAEEAARSYPKSARRAAARPVPRARKPRAASPRPAPLPVQRSAGRLSRRSLRRMSGWVPFTLAVFAVVCCVLGVIALSALSSAIGRLPLEATAPPPAANAPAAWPTPPPAPVIVAVQAAPATPRPARTAASPPATPTAASAASSVNRNSPALYIRASPTTAIESLPDNLWPLPVTPTP